MEDDENVLTLYFLEGVMEDDSTPIEISCFTYRAFSPQLAHPLIV